MNNKLTLRGRIVALFFIVNLLLNFNIISVSAASNIWGQWQTATIDNQNHDNCILTLSNQFSLELWHYSGGYWGNNYIKILDSQVFDDPDELANKVNAQMQFEMDIPQEIINEINNGYDVNIALDTNEIPLEKIFDLNKEFYFKFENNKMYFKAYPKFNFFKEYNYKKDFIPGLNKAIPFVVAPYGYNRYSMWTRSGSHKGAANGYFDPNNPYEIDTDGAIHPSQIINNKGYLTNDFNVYVDRENGSFDWMSSNNLAVGYNTFVNAGAVAIHFDYPVKILFYRGENLNNGPDVAVTKIERTSYPSNQGVMATVTVQNLKSEPQETELDFSIPNIIDANEVLFLEANETKEIEFYFQTPTSGIIPMTAEVNKKRSFKECDYGNNKKTVNAAIETQNIDTKTEDVITWTETESHIKETPCPNHGTHKTPCNHTFTYETTLTANHTISPKTLKSGYGFNINADTLVSTKLIKNSGCNLWGHNRTPRQTPKPPTKAEVRLNYTVTNSLGTQNYNVSMDNSTTTSTTSAFVTPVNPISVIGSRTIFTEVSLKGTPELPFAHSFEIYFTGGGVNGKEFKKSITGNFNISGSMHDDDGTSS